MAVDSTPGLRPLKNAVKRVLPRPIRTALQAAVGAGTIRVSGKMTFLAPDLVTSNNCDFREEPRFLEAYDAGCRTGSWGGADVRWKVHVACWAGAHAKNLPGDFIECGVNRAGLSSAIMNYIDFQSLNKRFFLLDTFCGLVESQITQEEREQRITPHEYNYTECFEEVQERFRDHRNVRLIRGVVPDTLVQVDAEQVCYLSIDMNCVAPEIAAISHFWDRLVCGAVVLLDDYGSYRHIAQKSAFDGFAAQHKTEVLSIPTGQGLIIKP